MRKLVCCLLFSLACNVGYSQQPKPLAKALIFHASFDKTADADFAKGDAKIYTAKTLKRNSVQPGLHSDAVRLNAKQGRFGGSLEFIKKSPQVVFYQGAKNLPASQPIFGGTYSFWMRLSPDEDLPPGYVDPLQITDKAWNDASFFVDFTKDSPRKFRLGVFSNIDFWNPKKRKWDDIPDNERPLVTVDKPPFSRAKWTHVAITFKGLNGDSEGEAALYLDGEKQGEIRGKQKITWGDQRLAIMLGIYYRGGLDDFAVFRRSLTASEVRQLYGLPQGVSSLRR